MKKEIRPKANHLILKSSAILPVVSVLGRQTNIDSCQQI